jgi:hypothetical protein
MRCVWLAMMVLVLAGCSSVVGKAKRTGLGSDQPVQQVHVFSLLRLHTLSLGHLYRDVRQLEPELSEALAGVGVRGHIVDVESLVRSAELPVEFVVQERPLDSDSRYEQKRLPEDALLRAAAHGNGTSQDHLLLLLPTELHVHSVSGVVTGAVRWRLDDPSGASVAVGVFRYSADARGFPGKAIAQEIVSQLQRLGLAKQARTQPAAQG